MVKRFAPRSLFVLSVLGLILMVVACGGNNPTSTPVPPTINLPTALPPAPTAPPLTEAPTAVVPTTVPAADTATPPAAPATATTAAPEPTNTTASVTVNTTVPTRRPATVSSGSSSGGNTKSGGNTNSGGGTPPPQQGPLQGLYVAGIRYDPTFPRNQDPLTFYVTVVNRNSREQNYPICVEVFRPGEAKSFGISNCDFVNLPVGTHEVMAGTWTASGIKECVPIRARAVLHELDTDNVRLPLVTLTGGELWKDFQVCP